MAESKTRIGQWEATILGSGYPMSVFTFWALDYDAAVGRARHYFTQEEHPDSNVQITPRLMGGRQVTRMWPRHWLEEAKERESTKHFE